MVGTAQQVEFEVRQGDEGLFLRTVSRREACMSILRFLTRLFEPKLLLSCSPEAATHVRTVLLRGTRLMLPQSALCA